jgi:protein TonB
MYARYAIHWFAAALCTLGAALAEDVKQVSPVEAMNAIVSKENPTYPPIARQMKMEGVVEVKVTISETGKVEESDTVSGNPILAKAAVEAVRHWKFKPFKDDGKTIKVVTNLSVTFKL